jgi:phosphoglycolate phosphatase-like HAD superfamily hydrolase
MVKVVVLDVDGTLMDTNYQHTETWARALAEVGRLTPAADETIAVGTWDIVAVKASRIRTVAVLTGGARSSGASRRMSGARSPCLH